MKTNILIFLFIIIGKTAQSQFGNNVPIYDAKNIEFGLKSIDAFRLGNGNNNDCKNYIDGRVIFTNPIKNHQGSESSFGYYEFDFKMYLYGINNSGNEILIHTITKDVDDHWNGIYDFYNEDETPLNIEHLSYTDYFIKIKITKYITNNDPGFLIFYESAIWLQEETNPEPKCGQDSCPTFYNGDNCGTNDNNDNDNDGVINSLDNCPNTSNPNQNDSDSDGIGDVCDNNNGLPNLKTVKLKLTVDGVTYDTSQAVNSIPILKTGKSHNFQVTIENNDMGNSSSSPYELLVSTSRNAYPNGNGSPVYPYHSGNAGSIISQQNESDSFIDDNIIDNIGFLDLEEDTSYYMFIHVDPNNEINESNENINDNISVLEFKFDNTSSLAYLELGFGNVLTVPFQYRGNREVANLKIFRSILQPSGLKHSPSNNYNPLIDVNISPLSNKVNISNLPKGVYLIKIDGKKIKTFYKKTSGIITR